MAPRTAVAVESAASSGRADPADRARRRSSRPTPSARSSPTPSRCRRSTTSCARWARTRWSSSSTAYADGLTDDEAFQRGAGRGPRRVPGRAGSPTSGRSRAAALGPRARARRARCRPGWDGPPPDVGRGRLARRIAGIAAGARGCTPAPTSSAGRDGRRERRLVVHRPRLLVVALVVIGVVAVLAIARRRSGRPRVTALAARVRAIPTWQVTLGVALLVAGLPDRGPARLRGPADPVSRARSGRRWWRRRSTSRRSRRTSSSRSSTCGGDPGPRGRRPGRHLGHHATSTSSSRTRGSRPGSSR